MSTSTVETAPLPWLRSILDVALSIGSLFLINGLFEMSGTYRRGFFCDDETIMYPMKPQTVGIKGLAAIAFLPQIAVILVVEGLRLWRFPDEYVSTVEKGRGAWVRLASRVLKFYGFSMLALVISSFLTAVTKNAVGRLRPNFLDVCQPDFDWKHNCTTHEYITDYACTADRSQFELKDARQSFFSGHSSISASTAVFIVVYLQSRAAGEAWLNTLVPLAQAASVCGAVWVGLTRVYDHKHHWSDVATGLAVGAAVVVLVWRYAAGFEVAPLKRRARPAASTADLELRPGYYKNAAYEPTEAV